MTLKTTKKNKRTARKKPAPRVSRKPVTLDEQRNSKVLARLLTLLRNKEPVTSQQISKKMGCSNMVARRRIGQLCDCGYVIRVGTKRVGERGPMARTYRLGRRRKASSSSKLLRLARG